MSIWEMLGIEPTKDLVAIKKAYAAQAKRYHPEEHPEEYQRLRNAYKQAVKYSKYHAKTEASSYVMPELMLHKPESSQPEPPKPKPPRPKPESKPLQPKPEEPEEKLYFEMPEEPEQDVLPTGERKHQNECFSYDEVDDYLLPELVEQFYLEFEYIGWNPYLINNPNVWRCLCDKPGREELFANAEFRKELAARICSLPMMRMEAFTFWDQLFARYGDEIRQQGEWEKKRRRCARENHFSRAERTVTREEYDLHGKMLAQMRRHGMDAGLTTRESAEGYLNYYIPYMDRHREEMKKKHRSGGRARRMLNIIVAFSVGMLILAVIVNIYLYRQKDTEDEVPEEWADELSVDNDRAGSDSIDDEERIRQREAVWKDTLRTYESWLEEQKSTEGY